MFKLKDFVKNLNRRGYNFHYSNSMNVDMVSGNGLNITFTTTHIKATTDSDMTTKPKSWNDIRLYSNKSGGERTYVDFDDKLMELDKWITKNMKPEKRGNDSDKSDYYTVAQVWRNRLGDAVDTIPDLKLKPMNFNDAKTMASKFTDYKKGSLTRFAETYRLSNEELKKMDTPFHYEESADMFDGISDSEKSKRGEAIADVLHIGKKGDRYNIGVGLRAIGVFNTMMRILNDVNGDVGKFGSEIVDNFGNALTFSQNSKKLLVSTKWGSKTYSALGEVVFKFMTGTDKD